MFKYPDELFSDLKIRWDKTKESWPGRVPPLPDDEILKRLLEVAYHASFLTEEQRRIGFRLVWITRSSFSSKGNRYFGHIQHRPVIFENPREFTVGEILRLAPATDLTQALICVEQINKSKKSPQLRIWGLLETGSSWWHFVHGESDRGLPPPNVLTISSSEPGNLSLSRGGFILLSLRNGDVLRPISNIFTEGPVSEFFGGARQQMYEDTTRRLGADKFDLKGHDDNQPQRQYIRYLERLLFRIRQRSHGGTLLVVPDYMQSDDSGLEDRTHIKYPTNYDVAWALLVQVLVNHRQYYDLYFPLSDGKDEINVEKFRKCSFLEHERQDIEEALADSVRFIAALCGVDGAVVITDKLRVLGFGSEVIVPSPSLDRVRVAETSSGKSGKRVLFDNYGTRHRSAFRFCSSYEDAVAFVVSQDGGVKAIKRVGADVVIWPDINFGPLGI